jgi:hypothetical protein
MSSSIPENEVCVKAITEAGNLRTPLGGSSNAAYCEFHGTTKAISFTYGTPTSQAYMYWNGSDDLGLPNLDGSAIT